MSNWAALQEQLMGKPVAKRAKHGIHFQNSDGSITANFSGKPCHYFEGGLWKPIDTKLLALGDGYYGCPHSKVKIKPDGTVAVAGTDYVQRVELTSAQTGLLDGDKLVRKFAFGEQRMWVTEDGFRSEIQLNRIPTLTEARKLIASESGTLSKEYLKSLTTATDANGSIHTYSTFTAFRTWLAGANFPVVIDPDFGGAFSNVIFGTNAVYATARSNSDYEYSGDIDGFMRVGQSVTYNIYRSFIRFDTSSIGAGSTITQVNFKHTSGSWTSHSYEAQLVKHNWNGQTTEQKYDGCLSGDADDAVLIQTTDTPYWGTYTSGNLSTAWVSKTGTTYYSIRHGQDYANTPTDHNFFICGVSHATEGNRPVLTVTYTAAGGITPIVQYYNRLRRN